MDRLSYGQYGLVVIISAFIMALCFNLLSYFIICTILFLFSRQKFEEPIHAEGLTICYFHTMGYYLLLFLCIKMCNMVINENITFILIGSLTILFTFVMSTVPNKKEKLEKLFLGRKKENGKYADLFRFIKFDPTNKKLCEYEDRLKDSDMFTYYVFKYIFRDGLTWDETMDKLDIYERKELDKEIYAIYRTLQYVLDLKRLD